MIYLPGQKAKTKYLGTLMIKCWEGKKKNDTVNIKLTPHACSSYIRSIFTIWPFSTVVDLISLFFFFLVKRFHWFQPFSILVWFFENGVVCNLISLFEYLQNEWNCVVYDRYQQLIQFHFHFIMFPLSKDKLKNWQNIILFWKKCKRFYRSVKSKQGI